MDITAKNKPLQGFTLIELSIVLIIIGLLAAGILVGRDLMRAAEIRKIHRQFEEFVTAMQTFREKYQCMPGDCPVATSFFGAYPGCPDYTVATLALPATLIKDSFEILTCNGDGLGGLDNSSNTFYEMTTMWQHLSAAGLIPGQYAGGWPSSGGPAWVSEVNMPKVINPGSFWMALDGDRSILFSYLTSKASIVPGNFGTVFAASAGSINSQTRIFSPVEALSYDQKFDDGSPVTGQIMVAFGLTGCTSAPSGENVTSPYNSTAQYLSYDPTRKSQPNCSLIHKSGF